MNIFKQKGLTLVELMVSLVIGLIVTGVVMQVFISNRQTFQLQESMSRVQESGRMVLQIMGDEIRHAGKGLEEFPYGIEQKDKTVCVLAEDRCDALSVRAIYGRLGNGSGGEVADSDVLTLGRADSCDARVVANSGYSASKPANLKATKYCTSMKQGAVLMVTDFKQAVIFEVNNNPNTSNTPVTLNHAGPGNVVSNKLGGIEFDPGARVMGFTNLSFFVRETGAQDMNGNPVRALAVRHNLAGGNPVTDIVDGVELMRVYYGIPSGGSMQYRRSAQMAESDWERVTSVRLELLMVSDAVSQDASNQAVTFDGTPVAADGRFRQTYRTVVAIRGRI